MADDIRKKTSYTLKHPFEYEGNTITQLTFRRIKGKDIKEVNRIEDDIEKTAFMIARLSNMGPDMFDEMDGEDIEDVSKIIEGFMGRKARR